MGEEFRYHQIFSFAFSRSHTFGNVRNALIIHIVKSEAVIMSIPYSPRRPMHQPPRPPVQNIFLLLIAYRLVNAFVVRTFFQPDEYFQSLEPAWKIAFGEDQGSWITWVSECRRVNTVT